MTTVRRERREQRVQEDDAHSPLRFSRSSDAARPSRLLMMTLPSQRHSVSPSAATRRAREFQ
jgi:hypothetical protein